MMSYKDRKIIFLVQDIPEKTCAKVFFRTKSKSICLGVDIL